MECKSNVPSVEGPHVLKLRIDEFWTAWIYVSVMFGMSSSDSVTTSVQITSSTRDYLQPCLRETYI